MKNASSTTTLVNSSRVLASGHVPLFTSGHVLCLLPKSPGRSRGLVRMRGTARRFGEEGDGVCRHLETLVPTLLPKRKLREKIFSNVKPGKCTTRGSKIDEKIKIKII